MEPRLHDSLALDSGYLYAANAYFLPGDTPQITVIDVSRPGEEQIVGIFSAPVFGGDIKVINGRLFLIDGSPVGKPVLEQA